MHMKPEPQALNGFHRTGHPVRRRNLRIPCSVPTRLENSEQSVSGICTNLSLGGTLFIGPSVSVGETVNLTMELSSVGKIRLAGEVLGCRPHPSGSGMAIRFPLLTQGDLKAINRFVANQIS